MVSARLLRARTTLRRCRSTSVEVRSERSCSTLCPRGSSGARFLLESPQSAAVCPQSSPLLLLPSPLLSSPLLSSPLLSSPSPLLSCPLLFSPHPQRAMRPSLFLFDVIPWLLTECVGSGGAALGNVGWTHRPRVTGVPGYMSRKIRKFRTDKFDPRNKRKFCLMFVHGWGPAVYMIT